MRAPTTLLTVAATLLAATSAVASDIATTTVAATAQLGARTSLTVSTDLLRFDVTGSDTPAIATVDFVAGARTRSDGEVVLTVEPLRAIEGPGGAADADAAVEFAGDGTGTLAGRLEAAAPAVAGRWIGSGRRTGRLRFSLRSPASGAYTLPVRFVLSAP